MKNKKTHPGVIAVALTLLLSWAVHFIPDSTLEIPNIINAMWIKILLSTCLVAVGLFFYKPYASDSIEGGTRKSQYPASDYWWSIAGAAVLCAVLYLMFT